VKLIRCLAYGYSLQRNIAAKAASGKYVLYISGDTTVASNLIQRYLKAIEDGFDIVQGTVINVAEKSTFSKNMAKIYPIFYMPYLNTAYEQFSTINVLIRKDLLIKFPFNESLLSLEDKEWCFNIVNSVHFKRIQGAVVFHSVHETLKQYCKKIYKEAIALGQIVTSLKKEDKLSMNIFNWINWTRFALLILIIAAASLFSLSAMNAPILFFLVPVIFVISSPCIFLFRILKRISQNRIINSLIIYLYFYTVVFGVLRGTLKRKKNKIEVVF
jgi:glycosyltransferase involved in cell wall biosynthesis